jgi:hypothetical protein
MTYQEKLALVNKLIGELIAELGCGDKECESCKFGVALGEGDETRIKYLDQAYNEGYRIGMSHGGSNDFTS